MATLIQAEKVKYACSCKRLKPLCHLYYCKYCKPFALKCKECVIHESDQKYFCANCLDNKTLKEAIGTKFKCLKCFNCPCCQNSLMIRATSVQKSSQISSAPATQPALTASQSSPALANSDNQQQPAQQPPAPPQAQKVFYLMCGFCRWTTKDVKMPDATTLLDIWVPKENPNSGRVSELLQAYKIIASKEKSEKDRKKYPMSKRRTFHFSTPNPNQVSSSVVSPGSNISSTDKYGILGPISRRMRAGGNQQQNQEPASAQSFEAQLALLLKPAQTVENFEPLTEDYFTKAINISSNATINQRLANPEFQPARALDLIPLNKYYVIKESKRCNGCEHNLLKPESNINSIKFKLHQMAMFMVPEIRVVTTPQWKIDESNEVILSVTNKCEIDLTVSLESLEIGSELLQNLSNFAPNAEISFGSGEGMQLEIDRQDNARSQSATMKQEDLTTNGFVCFRRDNKLAIVCKVRPLSVLIEQEKSPVNVRVAFLVKHCLDPKAVSVETTSSSSSSTYMANVNAQKSIVQQRIFIDFGPLKFEDGLKVIPRPKYIEDCLFVNSATLKK